MQPETDAGLTELIFDNSMAGLQRQGPSTDTGARPLPTDVERGPGSLYNLVKLLAKESDFDLAVNKLRVSVVAAAARVNVKNSKGSTALHACGYLKRWDMAHVLLEAGADPLVRNAAGHSFFLTAVRDPEAPWESLFAGYSELLSKHRKFLEKEPRCSQGRFREGGGDGQSSALRPLRAGVPGAVLFTQELPAMSDAFELGEWSRFVSESGSTLFDASAGAVFCLVKSGPIAAVELSIARGLRFDALGAEALCRRALAEAWIAQGQSWPLVGKYLSLSNQREVLAAAIREEQFATVKVLAMAGWSYDEALIEGLEDAGAYDVADVLIDLQSTPPAPIGQEVVGKLVGSIRSVNGKAVKSKRVRKGAGGKGAGFRHKPDRKSSSMIANLDRPSKEASDFEYRERQPQAKAPLIIIKKARVQILPPSL